MTATQALLIVGVLTIILLLAFIKLYILYLVRARETKKTVQKWIANYESKMLNVVDAKELTKEEADERMELVYFETPMGFHIGLDFTYLDQEGNFKILLPTGEVIDTSLTDPEKD